MNAFILSTRGQPNPGALTVTNQRQHTQATPNWQAGDTITATLTNIGNGVATFRTPEDIVFQTDKDAVHGNVGDTINFQVIRSGRSGLTLKQIIGGEDTPPPPRGNVALADEVKELSKTIEKIRDEDGERLEDQQERQTKAARAVAKIQRAQSFMSGVSRKSAMAALLESGLSPNKISFAVLDRVMHHADKRPEADLSPGAIKQALSQSFTRKTDAPQIIQSLHRHGLSVSGKNIAVLERAWDKLPVRVDDRTIERLITNESPLTLENLYVSRYSAPDIATAGSTPNTANDARWAAMAGEVQKLFEREGIESTRDNREAARFLLTRDLPLNKENVEKVAFLRRLGEDASKAALYDKAAEALSADHAPGEIPLTDIVTETNAARMVEPVVTHNDWITTRRLLAEVQLKYSAEASARLSDSRLTPVDTQPLRDTLQQLKQQETEHYTRFLRIAGADETSAPRMTDLFDALADIRPLTANVHAGILRGQTAFTISGVHETVLAARAASGYEMFATVPNPRFGDSFSKVRSQFEPLLTDIGITATKENMKAAFILSRNQMDVNWENIQSVKEIDAKLNTISDRLHPMIAAHMIKDGLNPLDMRADDVLEYIARFRDEYGENGSDQIVRHIMEMDEDRTLDTDTRERMIAIYRMLHVIQKNGAAALGLAAQQDTPLTLGRLMDLSKYYETRKHTDTAINRAVDDAFGHLERVARPEDSIAARLEGKRPQTYTDLIADAFIDTAKPSALHKLLTEVPGGTDLPLEDKPIDDEPIEDGGEQPTAENGESLPVLPDNRAIQQQLETLISASPEWITFLHKRNIPATVGMVKAVSESAKKPRALAEALNALSQKQDSEEDDESGELSDIIDRIPDTHLQMLREGYPPTRVFAQIWAALDEKPPESAQNATYVEAARQLAALRNGLNEENGFQIPIRMNGRVETLSMYVLNERALTEEGARVYLSLDTKRLGAVRGYFTIQDGAVDLLVTAGTRNAVSALRDESESLRILLSDAGVSLQSLRFEVSEDQPPQVEQPPDAASRRDTPSAMYEYRV